MNKILFLIIIIFSIKLQGQSDIKYQEIDALIESNSMINAMDAIKKLKEDFAKDSINSDYWLRHSKASFVFFRYEDASSSIDKAIQLNPNDAELYFEKGLLNNKIHKLEIALQAFEKAVNIKKVGKYYYWKGIVNQQLRETQSAEDDYQAAIENKFESRELFNNLAILLAESGNNEKALVMINKAINLDNQYPQAYSARAKINFSLLNFDLACKDGKTAVKLGHKNPFQLPDSICNGTLNQKLQFASDLFTVNKLYKQGIIAYTMLINNKATKSDNFLNRGYCYFQIKEYVNAEKDYLKALSLPKASRDQIYDNLSLLYFDMNNFEKSIEYATKRIELDPKNHVPYIDRGLCYRKLKNYSNAEKDFNTSLELKPDFFRAFGYRSFLYLELGQYKKSFEDASKSIKINPKYGYGYIVLAQAKQQIGISDFCEDYYNAKKYGEREAEQGIKEYCK
ncbi:tetratricopeptide repeat protein [Flavobacterium sp. Fl-77]|uniref:Tetratricopeptide repeat protein n=1 Tax=Flavobacterium flavipigmentatum TaxID=2893884 RepID=A0AAJ2VYI5_9FLAO|nr:MULTISPECIES: tetratricopeptide repeat protein [unclassified Flavobacterium]MDX6183796.1 tetratricopeptide repeat protein [Flavobacterium sp. Fl-33]MDX6187243.1 tetratricopeptide repeat protein [Flavobacterium sp. Fl-77]UFH38058.1 tetratricopeptide repeat protein [Flavobacterium sp. F-70]